MKTTDAKLADPCVAHRRVAADKKRGVDTSGKAVAFVMRTCPCGSCAAWRKSISR